MTTRTRKRSVRPASPAAGEIARDAGPDGTARLETGPPGVAAPKSPGAQARIKPRTEPGRRRGREKPRPSYVQAWGPLIAVRAIALAALAALAINPYLIH